MLQPPISITTTISQYHYSDAFSTTRCVAGLKVNHHQICHDLTDFIQTITTPIHDVLSSETKRLHITTMIRTSRRHTVLVFLSSFVRHCIKVSISTVLLLMISANARRTIFMMTSNLTDPPTLVVISLCHD